MKLIFDPVKRDTTLRIRGLDFTDAAELFAGVHKTRTDTRRIISMRKANEREQKRFAPPDAH